MIYDPSQTWLEHRGRNGSSARGPTGGRTVSHAVDPTPGRQAVMLDLRHAEAPQPNAVLR